MTTTDDVGAQVFGLAEILQVVRRRWRWVVGAVVVITGLLLALSLQQTPKYKATTRVLLRTVAQQDLVTVDPNQAVPFFADRQIQNELQVIKSGELRRAVEKKYDGDLSVADVDAEVAETGSDAVLISITAEDADEAAKLANIYADTYIDFNRTERLDGYVSARTEIQSRLDDLKKQRDAVTAPVTALINQIIADPNNQALKTQQQALVAQLQPQVDSIDNLQETYSASLEKLNLSSGLLTVADSAKVLDEAKVPTEPESPKPVRDGVIGVMLGLGLGLALALAREFLDDSIRTTADIDRVVRGQLPILGVIPDADEADVVGVADASAHSAVAEAFRALRTSVRFAELDRTMKVIQITSGSQGEGKTTTTANLALMLAQAGHRVAVVCCDLRRPQIHERFGVNVNPGLADIVLGECTLAQAVQPVGELIFVLAAGTSPPNPSELLGSGRAERVIIALAEEMDYVLIDTTPILPVTDSLVVSRFVDATIVVVGAGDTSRTELQRTLTALDQASAPVIGLVLNRSSSGDRNTYGYTYGRGGYNKSKRYVSKTGAPASRGRLSRMLGLGKSSGNGTGPDPADKVPTGTSARQ